MTRFCVDASAVLALVLTNETTATVRNFWNNVQLEDEVIGAQLLYCECTSIIRGKAYEGSISHDSAMRALNATLALPISPINDPRQVTMEIELAQRTNRRKAYDMQYLAVAELTGAELVTLDGGLRQAAIERRVPVRFLR